MGTGEDWEREGLKDQIYLREAEFLEQEHFYKEEERKKLLLLPAKINIEMYDFKNLTDKQKKKVAEDIEKALSKIETAKSEIINTFIKNNVITNPGVGVKFYEKLDKIFSYIYEEFGAMPTYLKNYKLRRKRSNETGTYMTIEEFKENVESGMFIDYDGFGKYATQTHVSDLEIYPSDFKNPALIRKDFTHVLWFNK